MSLRYRCIVKKVFRVVHAVLCHISARSLRSSNTNLLSVPGSTQPLPPAVSALLTVPTQSGTHSLLAFAYVPYRLVKTHCFEQAFSSS